MSTQSDIKPAVGILMGSDSDWPTMKQAADALAEFGIASEARVISAHRDPHGLEEYVGSAIKRGLKVIIAGAGGAAHLPGVTAAFTTLPVIGVPIESKSLKGLDSLLAIVQMPGGVPVATVAIGGAQNAGLLAAQILATDNAELQAKLAAFKIKLRDQSRAKNEAMQSGKVRDQKERSV
jgi:5-(carboxyamino)imidazole ribonucleotide mutase